MINNFGIIFLHIYNVLIDPRTLFAHIVIYINDINLNINPNPTQNLIYVLLSYLPISSSPTLYALLAFFGLGLMKVQTISKSHRTQTFAKGFFLMS